MGRKGEKLGFALFYGGEQIDRLPSEALDSISKRLSRVMSDYYSAHPDEYARLHLPEAAEVVSKRKFCGENSRCYKEETA